MKSFTPAEVGKRYNMSTKTILCLIRSGELRAIRVSPPGSRRPRFRITPEALGEWEAVSRLIPPRFLVPGRFPPSSLAMVGLAPKRLS
jgi:hypothetical protein